MKAIYVDSTFIPSTVVDGNGNLMPNPPTLGAARWYNNLKVYTFKPSNTPGITYPTIFLVPGGGFASLVTDGFYNTQASFGLATSLASDYNVIMVSYDVANGVDKNKILQILNCTAGSVVHKATFYKAALESYYDFRRIIYENIANAAQNNIDTSKMVMLGFSAGGNLVLNYVYLDNTEIPLTIANYPTSGATYTLDNDLRNGFYPVFKMKGIISMAGPSLYNTMFQNNNIPATPTYIMHGTCDEIVNEGTANFINKCFSLTGTPSLNTLNSNYYPTTYGGTTLYGIMRDLNLPIYYERVCRGSHQPIPVMVNNNGTSLLTWDKYDTTIAGNLYPNNTDPVEDRIRIFTNTVCSPPYTYLTGFQYMIPEGLSSKCISPTETSAPAKPTTITTSCVNSCCSPGIFGNNLVTCTAVPKAIQYVWRFANSPVRYTTYLPQILLDTIGTHKYINCYQSYCSITYCQYKCTLRVNVATTNGCDTSDWRSKDFPDAITYYLGTNIPECAPSSRMNTSTPDIEIEASKSLEDRYDILLHDNNTISLTSPHQILGTFEIYDMQGRLIDEFTKETLAGTNIIDLNYLPPKGMLIIKYSNDYIELNKKVILK